MFAFLIVDWVILKHNDFKNSPSYLMGISLEVKIVALGSRISIKQPFSIFGSYHPFHHFSEAVF